MRLHTGSATKPRSKWRPWVYEPPRSTILSEVAAFAGCQGTDRFAVTSWMRRILLRNILRELPDYKFLKEIDDGGFTNTEKHVSEYPSGSTVFRGIVEI